jgi:WD40 repeat protein
MRNIPNQSDSRQTWNKARSLYLTVSTALFALCLANRSLAEDRLTIESKNREFDHVFCLVFSPDSKVVATSYEKIVF